MHPCSFPEEFLAAFQKNLLGETSKTISAGISRRVSGWILWWFPEEIWRVFGGIAATVGRIPEKFLRRAHRAFEVEFSMELLEELLKEVRHFRRNSWDSFRTNSGKRFWKNHWNNSQMNFLRFTPSTAFKEIMAGTFGRVFFLKNFPKTPGVPDEFSTGVPRTSTLSSEACEEILGNTPRGIRRRMFWRIYRDTLRKFQMGTVKELPVKLQNEFQETSWRRCKIVLNLINSKRNWRDFWRSPQKKKWNFCRRILEKILNSLKKNWKNFKGAFSGLTW